MINRDKYWKLIDELCRLIPERDRNMAISAPSSQARVDGLMHLIRNALLSSSIYRYNGAPYFFGGKIYEPFTWNDFDNLMYDLLRKLELPNGDFGRLSAITAVCRRAVMSRELRLNNEIMVFDNCVYDFNQKKAFPFSKDFVQISKVGYDYNSAEHVLLWSDFINEVLPDPTLRDTLQMFLGSIFIDRHTVKLENMMILYGSGSNGKSVVFETIKGILGDENVSNIGISALITGSESKKNIAYINGKRLNYCSEIQVLEFGRESDTLKALISGEPTIARAMYGDNFTAYDIPLMMANANRLPALTDTSYGMRRRLTVVPFSVHIPPEKQNKRLAQDLMAEYPAIFNWIIEGRDKFIANDYKLPDAKVIEKLAVEYRTEMNSVLRFMSVKGYLMNNTDDKVMPLWMDCKKLYNQYLIWCRENTIIPDKKTVFTRTLTTTGYKRRRVASGYEFGIYGELLDKMYRLECQTEEQHKQHKINAIPVMHGSRRFIYTIRGLEAFTGINRGTIVRLKTAGDLDGTFYMDQGKVVFDVDQVLDRFKALKEADKLPDSDKNYIRVRNRELALMRSKFNQQMADMGMPYRKYKHQNDMSDLKDIIVVPDEFEPTEDELDPIYIQEIYGININ